ncbi:MAG: hypothetical protein RL539_63 [Pseudomonadota bacterium]|jgi:hypothetical protein
MFRAQENAVGAVIGTVQAVIDSVDVAIDSLHAWILWA